MGRPKRYDRADLVAKAGDLFHDHGYAGTSTAMLVEHLAVNRKSFYSEFESKQALFDLCLARYGETVISRNFAPLETADAGLEQIDSLLEFYEAAASGKGSGRGCFLCNTAVEWGPEDPSGQRFVGRYFRRISSAFGNALKNAQREGAIAEDVDVREESRFLTALVLGIYVLIRAKAPAASVKASCRAASRHLHGLG
jgi:TetR/AcrR family transcriptional repressor of nem operon